MRVEPIAHRHAAAPPDEYGRYLHAVVQQHADERFPSVRAFANVLVVNDRGDRARRASIINLLDESAVDGAARSEQSSHSVIQPAEGYSFGCFHRARSRAHTRPARTVVVSEKRKTVAKDSQSRRFLILGRI